MVSAVKSLPDCDHDGDCSDWYRDWGNFDEKFGKDRFGSKYDGRCARLTDRRGNIDMKKCVDRMRGCYANNGGNVFKGTNWMGFDWATECKFPEPAPVVVEEVKPVVKPQI